MFGCHQPQDDEVPVELVTLDTLCERWEETPSSLSPLPDARKSLAFSVVRVPFFLEPTLRRRRQTPLWKPTCERHGGVGNDSNTNPQPQGEGPGSHFNLDRFTSNTHGSHTDLIQHVGTQHGLWVSEAAVVTAVSTKGSRNRTTTKP